MTYITSIGLTQTLRTGSRYEESNHIAVVEQLAMLTDNTIDRLSNLSRTTTKTLTCYSSIQMHSKTTVYTLYIWNIYAENKQIVRLYVIQAANQSSLLQKMQNKVKEA